MSDGTFGSMVSQQMERAAGDVGGFLPLEREIQRVTGSKDPPIKRRQLRKLAARVDLPLTLTQLEALDKYFQTRYATSLSILFGASSVLRRVAGHGEVVFILGSTPDESTRRIDLSRWDTKAMRYLINDLQMYSQIRPPRILFEDVIFRGKGGQEFASEPVAEIEAWYHVLKEPNGPSALIVGSQIANHAAEVVLAKMWSVTPFERWPKGRKRPFAFIWPSHDRRASAITSCFKMDATEDKDELLELTDATPKLLERLQQQKAETSAVLIDNKLFEVHRSGKEWDSYAVLAAQRLGGKKIHVCIAGLTGPATLGAAELLPRFAEGMSLHVTGSSAVWALARVHVIDDREGQPKFRSDMRRVSSKEFVGEVRHVDSVE